MAKIYASRLLNIGLITGTFLGGLLAVLAPWLSIPFNLSPTVAHMTSRSLLSLGLLVPIKAYNMVLVVGVLRSGGDTRFSMFAELTGVWLIGVPCVFIGLEEAFKLVVGAFRIKSGKWINRLTEDVPTLQETLA
jgi:Na+-driven multidrug efflux pump